MSKQKKQITASGNLPRPGQTGARTIILSQPSRFFLDMATYMTAIRGAENVDYSRRVKLYDLYSEVLMDGHLYSVINKRKSAVLFTPIEFRRDGVPDDAINEQLRSPWFHRFLSDVWDSQAWGFSLMQFYLETPPTGGAKGGTWINYNLIPRKHVDPVKRLIMHRQGDIHGEDWDGFPDLLFIGNSEDLGLLAAASPYVIYKRNTMADWAQFCEIFGMPIRKYTYDANDDEARQRVINDAYNEGGGGVYVMPENSNLEFVESGNKTGSAELYETFTERCNSEISKLFLGNTLTTEASNTGTQALGTIQKQSEKEINAADRKFILNVLNYDMTDLFASMGINTQGGSFEFVEPDEVAPDKKIAIIRELYNMGVPISHDYLYEEFGIEKPEKNTAITVSPNPSEGGEKITPPSEGQGGGSSPKNNWLSSFFDKARRSERALKW
jgi:phage gp29-like protein